MWWLDYGAEPGATAGYQVRAWVLHVQQVITVTKSLLT